MGCVVYPASDSQAPESGMGLLAKANHDLRQPLHAAQLFHAALQRRNRDAALVGTIDNLGRSLEGLTNALEPLIAIARLDGGRETIHAIQFPLADVMSRVCDRIEAPLRHAGVELRVVASSIDITSDPLLFETLLRYLVLGGLALADGERVVVGCRRGPPPWRLQVAVGGGPAWSGPAAAEELGAVFETYQQVEAKRRAAAWVSGLDLVVVGRCARVLGLRVALHTALRRGVWFDLAPAVGSAPVC